MKYGFHFLVLPALLAVLVSAGKPFNRCKTDKDCNGGCCLYDGTVSLDFGFCDNESSCSPDTSMPSEDLTSNRQKRENENPQQKVRTNTRSSRNFNATAQSSAKTSELTTAASKTGGTKQPKTTDVTTAKTATTTVSTAEPEVSTESPTTSAATVTTAAKVVTTTAASAKPEVTTKSSTSTTTSVNAKNAVGDSSLSNERNIVIPDAPKLPVDLDIVNSFLKPFAPLIFASGFVGLPIAVLALTVLAPPPFPAPPATTTESAVKAAPTTQAAAVNPKPQSPWDTYGAAQPWQGQYYPQEPSYLQAAIKQPPMQSYDQPRPQYKRQKRRGLIGDIIEAFSAY